MPKRPKTGKKFTRKENKEMLHEDCRVEETGETYHQFNPGEENQQNSRSAKRATQALKLEREESRIYKATEAIELTSQSNSNKLVNSVK